MPTTLQFPPIHPKPEISLQNLLKKHGIIDFGHFGYWSALVRIGHKGKWARKHLSAKIDTGASISLLPLKLKTDLNLGSGIPYTLYGVVRSDECKVDVVLYQLDIELSDYLGKNLIFKNVWVALSKLEKTPILLGYKDLLQRCHITQLKDSEILTISKRKNKANK